MASKSDSFSWNDAWGSSSGGKQEEKKRSKKSGTSYSATGKGQAEATGAEDFFGFQYMFPPVEAPREQYTVATQKMTGHTVADFRSNAPERSITPVRCNGKGRKGGRREGKRRQKDSDINNNRWYQSKNKDMQGGSTRKQPQNGDELLRKQDSPQTGDEGNRLQEQKQSEDTPESSNFLNFLFDKAKGNDGIRDHVSKDTARLISAIENDRNPTNGRDNAGDSSLPFLNYFWRIEPLEESPGLLRPRSAVISEVRDEGIMSEKPSSLQEDDEAPLRMHRRKRWFSKQGKTDQDGNNGIQGPRFEEAKEDVPDQDYGLSVEYALEEEYYLKSRNCMSFRRNPEARGSGIFSGRGLSRLSLDPEIDQNRKNGIQSPPFKEDVPGRKFDVDSSLSVDVAREEGDYLEPRNCMSLRRKDMQRVGREGSRAESLQQGPQKSRDDDERGASQWRAPVESQETGEHERSTRRNWLARHSTSEQDYGASVDDALEEEDYSETRNCMSLRRNPGARGGGIFLGRVIDESRRESTSRRDTLTIEEEEQRATARGVSRLQDLNRQEQDRALQGKERLSSSLPATELSSPAKEPYLPAKGRQSVPVLQSRRDGKERVQPKVPKGSSLWQDAMWGLLSVDSLDAEETARSVTRTPIRINRSTSKKKAPVDGPSIMAASWDNYDDEDCYSNSSASSVFSLHSLDAW